MKKLNKLFAILVAMAMVLSLGVVSAFAATENTAGTKVEKVLTMPKGVDPSGSITIKATLNTIDGVAPAEDDNTGIIADQVINLAKANAVKVVSNDASDVYYYETENVVLADDYHGGVYKYTIKEDVTNWTAPEGATKTPDTNEYEMTVNVAADKTVKQVYVGTDENKKELYTDVTEENAEKMASDGTVFKNSIKQDKTSENYDNSALKAKKEVKADENDIADQTTKFAFQAKVTLPNTTSADTATWKIERKDGTTETGSVTGTDEQTVDFALAHGDQFFFTSIPVGAKVSIGETDSRVGVSYTKAGNEYTNEIIAADSSYAAEITNTKTKTDATGILMSNLPYIVLALVAIGGMVAYVVVRRRNADEA
jgi:hypothetical protein